MKQETAKNCDHCGKVFVFIPKGGRARRYCGHSCKDMHYQQTEKGRVAKKRADIKSYYSQKGRERRSEYNSTVARIVSNRMSRKKSMYSGNGIKRLETDGYRCTICGFDTIRESLQISHVVPRCKGGSDEIENLRTVCANCHAFITAWEKIFLCDTGTEFDWQLLYEEAEDEIRARYANTKGER